jgi:hypothetical protein
MIVRLPHSGFNDAPGRYDVRRAARCTTRSCNTGLKESSAKRRNGVYRPGYRGWTKVKNPSYWRRGSELQLMRRRGERVGAW